MAFQEMSRDEFIAMLVSRGWTKEEATAEWDRIQEEPDESGYDGP
jgi:hypothetical protein